MSENGIDNQVATQLPANGAQQTEQPAPPIEIDDEWYYEIWELTHQDHGTVRYYRFDTSGTGRDYRWGNEVGDVILRQQGGPGSVKSRIAVSKMRASLPVGTLRETIIVLYRHGKKYGSRREYDRLETFWDGCGHDYVWREVKRK